MLTNEQRFELALDLIERAGGLTLALSLKDAEKALDEKLFCATMMLELVEEIDCGPKINDDSWYKDLFAFTGEHMILTEEGWIPAEMNTKEYTLTLGTEPVEVLDSVNVPVE